MNDVVFFVRVQLLHTPGCLDGGLQHHSLRDSHTTVIIFMPLMAVLGMDTSHNNHMTIQKNKNIRRVVSTATSSKAQRKLGGEIAPAKQRIQPPSTISRSKDRSRANDQSEDND